jgi:hypothetical protein
VDWQLSWMEYGEKEEKKRKKGRYSRCADKFDGVP